MSKLSEGLLDIFFPPKCAFCRRRLRAGETVYFTLYQREGAQKEAV